MERTEVKKKKRKASSGDDRQLVTKKIKSQSQTRKPTKKVRRSVGIDSLRWQTSTLSDMTNDAEGFYGLEEVDDVEVYRNTDNTVEFRAIETKSEAGSEAIEDKDDFEGFADEPATQIPSETSTRPAVTEPNLDDSKRSKKETKSKKQGKKPNQPTLDPELESNVFTGLDNLEDTQPESDVSAWVALGLSPQLLSSIAKLAFEKPTAIQAATIPHIMAGHDTIGKASTGSGKTLAFAIPIVERWLDTINDGESSKDSRGPIALILSPTRELAHQLSDHIKALCQGLCDSPYICSVTGGLAIQKQQRQLSKADIVIGTPGRLWEVLSSNSELMESFKGISFLVVDEADRLLTEGHFKEAKELFDALDRVIADEDDSQGHELTPRQTLVFSATFHKGLQQKLAGKGKYGLMNEEDSMEYLLKKLNFRDDNPKLVDVNPISQMAKGLKEGLVECGAMEKDLYLYTLLLLYPNARALVFTNSISSARRITPMLQNLNQTSYPLHSEMPQKARLRSLERFTATPSGQSATLVATDVAARGLDIPNVDLVIHYHVPRAADAYVHRSGRTARAEQTGVSILLCGPEEVIPTRRLIAKVHSESKRASKNHFVQTLDMDRKLAGRLKPRVTLAKKIADSVLAKEKGTKEDDWMRKAAEELGVEYDSEELEKAGSWGGRGSHRKEKQKEARGMTKAELGALKGELKALLSQRVNTGVSEKYIATGMVDIDELLRGAKGDFLGRVEGLDIESL